MVSGSASAASTKFDLKFEEACQMITCIFGINELFEDQKRSIKAFCKGKNIYVDAATGYGKLIIFQALPYLQRPDMGHINTYCNLSSSIAHGGPMQTDERDGYCTPR